MSIQSDVSMYRVIFLYPEWCVYTQIVVSINRAMCLRTEWCVYAQIDESMHSDVSVYSDH